MIGLFCVFVLLFVYHVIEFFCFCFRFSCVEHMFVFKCLLLLFVVISYVFVGNSCFLFCYTFSIARSIFWKKNAPARSTAQGNLTCFIKFSKFSQSPNKNHQRITKFHPNSSKINFKFKNICKTLLKSYKCHTCL